MTVEAEHLTDLFKLDVRIEASQTVKVTKEDLAEIRREAERKYALDDDGFLLDQLNELVEAKLDSYFWEWWDFDWSGAKQSTLFEAIRDTEPAPIPEIPGQLQIEGDWASPPVRVRPVETIEPEDFV